jgi:hypothetical protein
VTANPGLSMKTVLLGTAAESPFLVFQTGQGQRRAEECVAVGCIHDHDVPADGAPRR